MKAAIVGISGPVLSDREAEILHAHRPAGVILFGRNVQHPAQLARLTAALREVLPPRAVLMVDQEGGRVARLRPPRWRGHPSARTIGLMARRDRSAGLQVAWLTGALIGLDCAAVGFDVVCAPVLDLTVPGQSDVVGDRSYGADPVLVGAVGRAVADGLLAAGVQPVAKHAPGHGRARADSHHELPVVEDDDLHQDIAPFVRNADLPWMMTAHILYTALDDACPATLSLKVIRKIIRGRIGFGGVLVSDDLAMGALSGSPAERAHGALEAGCDIALYCAGDPDENAALLADCPKLSAPSAGRLEAARALAETRRMELDAESLAAERDRLLA